MVFPVNKPHRIGLRFGASYGSILSRLLGPRHAGIDILPEIKEEIPVLAIDNGFLTRTGYLGSCGLSVDYVTGEYKVRYCHLKSITAQPGKITGGQELGLMGATGVSYPKGFKHLHWVIWLKGKLIDPLSLTYTNTVTTNTVEKFDIPTEFQRIWKRPGATGEIAYFERRLHRGTIKGTKDLREKMSYWHGIVYPNGKYSLVGDLKWKKEKAK